ncbi:MAG TPA: hypothetical protein VK608_12380 [Edaphobacter sp.]|nr:hypothetical protein [Edaphobacter sp.]
MVTSQNVSSREKLILSVATFGFLLAESQAFITVQRGQHIFAFPSFLSSYWLPVAALIPALVGFFGIHSLYGKYATKIDPTVRSKIVIWFSLTLMWAYVLFGYTINTIQVMTARW